MDIGAIFNNLFLIPLINLLVGIYQGLSILHIPGALGFSLFILTIIIRLLAWPLMAGQIKSTKKMAELKPYLDELKSKHKDDKQAMASAQMALYKEHGVNPAGGCLPALIQIPLFIGLYQAILHIIPGMGSVNLGWTNSILYFPWMHLQAMPDPNFFGLNLGVKPSQFTTYGIALLLIPLITALLTFIQSQMTLAKASVKPYPSDSPKEKKEKEGMEESMSQVQSQMVYMMPLMIGYFAFSFPVGLAIYWNCYTILGIIQQHKVSGWGGMEDLVKKITRPSGGGKK